MHTQKRKRVVSFISYLPITLLNIENISAADDINKIAYPLKKTKEFKHLRDFCLNLI